MPSLSKAEKQAISEEVVDAINHYTDEHVDRDIGPDDAKKILLTKSLGIGPTLIGQLSVPLTKISDRHGGRGVGIFDAQGAKSVLDCINLVYKSIPGGA